MNIFINYRKLSLSRKLVDLQPTAHSSTPLKKYSLTRKLVDLQHKPKNSHLMSLLLTNSTSYSIINLQFIKKIGRSVNKAPTRVCHKMTPGSAWEKEGTPSFF